MSARDQAITNPVSPVPQPQPWRRQALLALVSVAIAMACGACSSGFQRDWNAAATATNRSGIEGRWDGTWTSGSNGHSGKLRCLVTRTERPDTYRFRYWGTFAKVFRFDYTVACSAERPPGDRAWHLQGESDLGIMGGVFRHRAIVSDDCFRASYASRWDEGTFELRRP